MVLVRRIRKRNATIVVEAHGEVLFTPTGDVGRWTNRLSNRITAFASKEAPANKRPRWAHYSAETLKRSMTSSTVYQPGNMRVYSAVGSRKYYAAYVDQGTGIYAGGSPWKARILPPWAHGSPSLYENTWRPGGPPNPQVRQVMIKGQRGQFFFDKALKRGFQSMRMRSYQVPGEIGVSDARNPAVSLFAAKAAAGEGTASTLFRPQLEEWRAWRDAAFNKGRVIGRETTGRPFSSSETAEGRRRRGRAQQAAARRQLNKKFNALRRKQASAERSKRWRAEQKRKNMDKPKQDPKAKGVLSRSQDRARVKALADRKFGASNVESIEYQNGQWKVLVRVITVREADGERRPEFKVFSLKARS